MKKFHLCSLQKMVNLIHDLGRCEIPGMSYISKKCNPTPSPKVPPGNPECRFPPPHKSKFRNKSCPLPSKSRGQILCPCRSLLSLNLSQYIRNDILDLRLKDIGDRPVILIPEEFIFRSRTVVNNKVLHGSSATGELEIVSPTTTTTTRQNSLFFIPLFPKFGHFYPIFVHSLNFSFRKVWIYTEGER